LSTVVEVREEDKVSSYVPVLLALFCSVMFMSVSLMFKYLTKTIGFEESTITFNVTGSVAFIVLVIGASWYWRT